jgi:hypothetical protein
VTTVIGIDEVRLVKAFAERQLAWDRTMPARVVTSTAALGIYTAPPMNVLGFLAVPWQGPSDFDRTVTLDSLNKAMTIDAGGDIDLDSMDAAPASIAHGVAMLPPAAGWQIPMHAVAGDLMVQVSAASQEFTDRASGRVARVQQDIAAEIWDRPAWAGLPMRVLHAAYRLGLLQNDRSRVSAATSGSWRRFATPRGQVFYRVPGDTARFDLQLVR